MISVDLCDSYHQYYDRHLKPGQFQIFIFGLKLWFDYCRTHYFDYIMYTYDFLHSLYIYTIPECTPKVSEVLKSSRPSALSLLIARQALLEVSISNPIFTLYSILLHCTLFFVNILIIYFCLFYSILLYFTLLISDLLLYSPHHTFSTLLILFVFMCE